MKKIRYKYTESKKGICLSNVRCPVCKSKYINWVRPVQMKSWDGDVILLAECWNGSTIIEEPKHLFYIKLTELPMVEIRKTENKK